MGAKDEKMANQKLKTSIISEYVLTDLVFKRENGGSGENRGKIM